jgi:hypothetical protein
MIPTRLSLLPPPRRAIRQLLSIRIVKQRLRRLMGIDEIMLPLTARELIIGEVAGVHRRHHPVTLLVVAQGVPVPRSSRHMLPMGERLMCQVGSKDRGDRPYQPGMGVAEEEVSAGDDGHRSRLVGV